MQRRRRCRLQPRWRHAAHRRAGRRATHLGPRRRSSIHPAPAGPLPNLRYLPKARSPRQVTTPSHMRAAKTSCSSSTSEQAERAPASKQAMASGARPRGGRTDDSTPVLATTGTSAPGTGTPDYSSTSVRSRPYTSPGWTTPATAGGSSSANRRALHTRIDAETLEPDGKAVELNRPMWNVDREP